MKNAINYFYNLFPDKIYKEKNHLYFFVDDTKICIYKYIRNILEINELVKISNELFKNNIPISTFIVNKENNFYFTFEEENYVLLKINNYQLGNVDIYDIDSFNNLLISKNNDSLNNLSYNFLWSQTIDNIEERLKDFNKEYLLLQDYINYYIGLGENAIIYYNNIMLENPNTKIDYRLSHRRISPKMNIEEFYNPINFIFDIEIRDLSLFVQNQVLNNEFDFDEFEKFLNSKNYNRFLIEIFYARLLYPVYYFDKVLLVINDLAEEKVLDYYHNKAESYEIFLFEMYNLLNSKYNIPSVEWITRME
ncbi:MAG: hypothetical protein IJB82_05005 [Bacilli bacterium]|nr:hypothetical protein [Bacilli bacterium]